MPLVVNTVHGFYLHSGMNPIARRIYILLEKLAATCSDCILSQNAEDVGIAVREHVCRPEKIKFLGNGIDLAQFDPDAVSTENVAKLRAELGLNRCARVVGFVGRLAAKRKGFADFLAAAREIAGRFPDCQFLVVGGSDHGKADAIEASAAGVHGVADCFVFAGQRDGNELPPFYKLMDVLVLPSIFEGLPRVVMEASAMGVPSVVTDVKGNREAVVHECNGLLVPLGDIRALANAVIRVLTDRGLANEMSAKGRAMALERFDEQATFATVKAEYRRLLSEKRPFSAPICFASNMTRLTMPPVSRIASARIAPAPGGDLSIRRRFCAEFASAGDREQLRQLSVAKRLFDVLAAAAALLILAPLLAALALVVRLAIGAPIIFKQQRPGLHGRPFMIYKFRTMSDARDAAGHFLPDAERLGWFGRFLRSTSLDELPELINVLRGEMSIVGPRPLLMEYLPRYSAEQMRRHDVLPGITGLGTDQWAQRSKLAAQVRVGCLVCRPPFDVAGPENYRRDTSWKVLKRDGINQSDRITSEPFMGNADVAQPQQACKVGLAVTELGPRR